MYRHGRGGPLAGDAGSSIGLYLSTNLGGEIIELEAGHRVTPCRSQAGL